LLEQGIGTTGTVRANRIEKCPLKADLKKDARGCFDIWHDKKESPIVCSWNDNSVVIMASNT